MELVYLGETRSFLDDVYMGCTQCEFKPNESIVDKYRQMLESRISAVATEQLPGCVSILNCT